jgi:hypothetical protein
MFDSFDNSGGKATSTGGMSGRSPGFSKIFRWQPPDPHAPSPGSVQVIGSFTGWRATPMTRDAFTNTWQLTLHGIPANRTHQYMLLVDGKPTPDKNGDGLATPQSLEEQQYQLMTVRGPRVFLLFAQSK